MSSIQLPLDSGEYDASSPPWEVVRWTKLNKLNGQAFSEAGKRNFGSPTCVAVSASVVLGTTKGILLVFDFHQNLKMILGPGTKGRNAFLEPLYTQLTLCGSRGIWAHNFGSRVCRPQYRGWRPC